MIHVRVSIPTLIQLRRKLVSFFDNFADNLRTFDQMLVGIPAVNEVIAMNKQLLAIAGTGESIPFAIFKPHNSCDCFHVEKSPGIKMWARTEDQIVTRCVPESARHGLGSHEESCARSFVLAPHRLWGNSGEILTT
jgi:hypothetical protein